MRPASRTGSGTSCTGSSHGRARRTRAGSRTTLLRSFGGTGLDAQLMLDRSHSSWVERQLTAAGRAAERIGVPGTPFFQVGSHGQEP